MSNRDMLFRKFLLRGPAAWSLIRVVESDLLSKHKLEKPVLDVGCGDGFFAAVMFDLYGIKNFDTGIDLDEDEIDRARKSHSYKNVVKGDAAHMPFKDGQFASAFSNGSIEHIEKFDESIKEISRVLKKGGKFVFTVPTKYLASYLFFNKLFKFLRLGIFGDIYGIQFNKLFKHHNLYNHEEWTKILKKHNMKVTQHTYYNLGGNIPLHDILTWVSFPTFFLKKIFGKWILFPHIREITYKLPFQLFKESINMETSLEKGPSVLIIAEKY